MSWGKSYWGVTRWGSAIQPLYSTKFTGYASKIHTSTSKFHGHAASDKTTYSKFTGTAGVEHYATSYFYGVALDAVLTFFTGVASKINTFETKFAGNAGKVKTPLSSKFSGRAGILNTTFSKFAGAAKIDRSTFSKFLGHAGRLMTPLSSKFLGYAAVDVETTTYFKGYASLLKSMVASKFYGESGHIPIIGSKFYGVSYNPLYWNLAGVDIKNYIRDLKWDGFGTKITASPIPGEEFTDIEDVGADPGSAEIELKFATDAEMQDFLTVCHNLSQGVLFYPGRDDRVMTVSHVSITPIESQYLRRRFRQKVTLYFEQKYALGVVANSYGGGLAVTLPAKSQDMTNSGSYKSQFTFNLQGYYTTTHSKILVASLYNGATLEKTFPISEKLLSDETAVLDEEGVITNSYSDSFTSSAKYGRDATASNCTWSSGKIRINATGYLIYCFSGPLLLNKDVKLIADLTVISGSPYILVSSDGVTYETSIPAADILSGLRTYWLSGTAKYGTVYVKIYCPTAAVLDVNSVAFECKRDVNRTVYYDQIPTVEPGESRALQISSTGGSGIVTMTLYLHSRWRP